MQVFFLSICVSCVLCDHVIAFIAPLFNPLETIHFCILITNLPNEATIVDFGTPFYLFSVILFNLLTY